MKIKTKSKKRIKIIATILATTLLMGYTNETNKIKFPGGAYVYKNGIQKYVNYDKFYYVEDDRVYFTMYDEIQDITDYCSNETYFVDQVRIGGYRQTVVIGGEIDQIICVSEFGWILELDDPMIDELELKALKDERFYGNSRYYLIGGPKDNLISPWLVNAKNDLQIDFYKEQYL